MSGKGALIQYQRVIVCYLLITAGVIIPARINGEFIKNVPVGPIDFIPLEYKPSSMFTAHLSERNVQDLIVTYTLPVMSIFSAEGSVIVDLDHIPAMLEPMRSKDKADNLVFVPIHKSEIQVIRFDKDEAKFKRVWEKKLDNSPVLLRTADVTNNGYDDILLLLQNTAGVGFIRNNGNGAFDEIEFLFDEILVSLFQVADINGDGINDFILFDPVKNALLFQYGFGDMVFSLGGVQNLPASISFFQAMPIVEDTIYDLLTVYPETTEFSVFFGDGLGRFRHIQTHKLTSGKKTFLFTDLFDNDRSDIVITEHKTGILRLYRNNTLRGYEPAGVIQLSTGIRDVITKTDPRSGASDLYILDVAKNRLIVLRLLPSVVDFLPPKLALSSEGTDLVTANFLEGPGPELFALCKETATISIYWYNHALELNHSMISVPGSPENLYVARGPENRTKLVVSDKITDVITIVSMQWERFESNMYGIPVMKSSEVIYLGVTPDARFKIGVLSFTPDNDTPTLSLFEQIAIDEYIEHTITPIQEERIIALDVIDITGNNAIDIVYMFRTDDGQHVYITSALNDSEYVYRRQGNILALEDSTSTRGFIISENTPDNHLSSFIIYLDEDGEKKGRIFRAAADRSGLLSWLSAHSSGPIIRYPDEIVLLRSPISSYNDLVYYNALTEHIEVMYSNDDGTLMPAKPIKKVDDLSAFTTYHDPVEDARVLVIGGKGKPYIEFSRINE